ncbi:esterase/lipase family protein [Shewanella violacea]|uniref:Lipase n=1 Tax=Shewanella violacea (strain JCM 10179 / CIP 106290 / LMG 19151 / DSS12) TaxID=637905 RepID=D4ZAI7_SHEVD|nr:triacylglycerol lipase [Shewanella violacea]BAJ03032.1 lipase [Shewanella violacea DSS12]
MNRWIYTLIILLLSLSSSFNATASTSTSATKYPIVLVHGLFGFDDIWGIDYFYKIPQTLQQQGAQVFVANVSPANSSEVRGEQLRNYVQAVLAQTGADKVNLIGHSHGSPTIRYVASVSPEMVASVTSIGGVNWGSNVADFVRGAIPADSAIEWLAQQGFNSLAAIIAGISGNSGLPTDTIAAMESLTTSGSVAFNQRYPEGIPAQFCGQGSALADNGVYYFSWSGASQLTHVFDVSDYPLSLTGLLFNEPNDGLVSSCSSHLGLVIKDNYKMNHLDEVNQTFGLVSWFDTNPVTLYRQHLNRLAQLGL